MNSQIKNMIRLGKVSSVNHAAGRVKVAFSDKDNIVSTELPYLAFEYNMPKVNDMVVCIFLGNGVSQGFCLGSYYSDFNKPKEAGSDIYYKDFFGEGFMKYDKLTKTLTIKAENIRIEGDLTVDGNLTVLGVVQSEEF